MINVIIYLPNGRTVKAFLKKRQYNYLIGNLSQKTPLKNKIKEWIRWPWFKRNRKKYFRGIKERFNH